MGVGVVVADLAARLPKCRKLWQKRQGKNVQLALCRWVWLVRVQQYLVGAVWRDVVMICNGVSLLKDALAMVMV